MVGFFIEDEGRPARRLVEKGPVSWLAFGVGLFLSDSILKCWILTSRFLRPVFGISPMRGKNSLFYSSVLTSVSSTLHIYHMNTLR